MTAPFAGGLTAGAPLAGPTLARARWIIGHRDGRHEIVEDGVIVWERDRVLFVGHDYPGDVARRVDFGERLIGPGFIDLDALSDLDTAVLAFDNQPAWRKGRVWPRGYVERGPREMYSFAELVFQKRYAFAQLIRNGITTALPIASLFYREWAETVPEFEAAADVAAELGLRVYLGPAYRAGHPVVEDDGRITLHVDEGRGLAGLEDATAFCRRVDGRHGGLVRAMLAPDRVETCTESLLRRSADAARDLGVPIRLHCCQSDFEVETMRRLHGTTAPLWLRSIGALSERMLMPHATHVADGDIAVIRDAGAVVVHCPLVMARHGAALRGFSRLRAAGTRIGLGTDTWPPDMVLNMQIGMLLDRVVEDQADAVRSEQYYDAATLGGADALGRGDLGRLRPGAKADFVVFDLCGDRVGLVIDPIQTLMVSGSGRDVSAVVIDGRPVMIDGIIPGFDMAAATEAARRQFGRLVACYPERTWRHPPVSDIFASSYPRRVGHLAGGGQSPSSRA